MTSKKDNSQEVFAKKMAEHIQPAKAMQVGAQGLRPKPRPASIPSFQARVNMVVKDYEREFHGFALKQRIADDNSELIIVFVDGRKFHFPFPPAWLP
jgi:hypothetical protein